MAWPDPGIRKEDAHHYRQASDGNDCCACVLKTSVPYMWCAIVGRRAEPGMTCDKHTGVK